MLPTDLAVTLDIPKATAHRLVQTLKQEGFIQINLRGQIVAAPRLESMAGRILYHGRFKLQRQAILHGLAVHTGETCGLAVPDGMHMSYHDRVEANWPLRIHLPVGSGVPVECTSSGKLYLSSLPEEELDRVLRHLVFTRRARNTITDPVQLKAVLATIRAEDLGTDNEEFIDGMVACSVPVRSQGQLAGCLFCHAPVVRESFESLRQFVPAMRAAARELESMLAEPASAPPYGA